MQFQVALLLLLQVGTALGQWPGTCDGTDATHTQTCLDNYFRGLGFAEPKDTAPHFANYTKMLNSIMQQYGEQGIDIYCDYEATLETCLGKLINTPCVDAENFSLMYFDLGTFDAIDYAINIPSMAYSCQNREQTGSLTSDHPPDIRQDFRFSPPYYHHGRAWIAAVPATFWYSFKMYATFYTLTTLVGAKGNIKKIDLSKWSMNTIRSTMFLAVNMIAYLFFQCIIRHLVGFHSIPTIGYANGLLAGLAILIEKRSRRPALAVYLTNIASDTFYRQLCNRGYLRTVAHGTCIPFAFGLALFKYLSSMGGLGKSIDGFLSSALQDTLDSSNAHILHLGKVVQKNMPTAFKMIENKCGKPELCDHEHSCFYNIAKVFLHNSSFGLVMSSLLVLLKNISKPGKIGSTILSKNNLKMPLFLGLLPMIYHASRCLLNRVPCSRLRPSPTSRDILAAAAAGSSMIVNPNINISMFVMWKAIEAFYTYLGDTGRARWIKHGDVLLYVFSSGYVMGCAAYEPHAIRESYMRFLDALSGHKLKLFNRAHFDFYGAESSKLYGRPDLHLNHNFVTIDPEIKPC